MSLADDARTFASRKTQIADAARSTVAFRLAFGIDLDDVLSGKTGDRSRYVLRIERLLERERLRGARGHWSYDLNRHIALKQALDAVRAGLSASLSRAQPG
jgi:hypothetical protein